MKILLTGGSGRLGQELQKLRHYEWVPSHAEFDITAKSNHFFSADLIVHCAAYTNVYLAESRHEECWNINVNGTRNVAAMGIPVLYISTEYVFSGDAYRSYTEEDAPSPINYYAFTKVVGEHEVRDRGKILRLVFKPNPWPYERAYANQFTSGDYVDVMAREVNKAITLFRKLPKITHIGTGRKSMYELARRTKPDVEANSIDESPVPVPVDCSLNTTLWEQLKKENGL